MCASVSGSENNLLKLVLSFYSMGSRDCIQDIRFCAKLYLLSHLTGSNLTLFKANKFRQDALEGASLQCGGQH